MPGNSPSSREECACARPFDATQWRHQLLYTACPVNSCSTIYLALGSGSKFGTLGTIASSPSTSSRIGSCAPPGTSGFGFSGLAGSDPADNPPIQNLQTVASHPPCFLLVSCRCCTRCFLCAFLLDPSINFLCNIRTFVEHVTFVTIQHSDSTHRRVFSNRQQRFTNRRLNTSNSEIGSPIIATHNMQSLATFDKFSSCCAESEITVTRNRSPVRDTLRPCRLSCTCVNSILDSF